MLKVNEVERYKGGEANIIGYKSTSHRIDNGNDIYMNRCVLMATVERSSEQRFKNGEEEPYLTLHQCHHYLSGTLNVNVNVLLTILY